MSSECRIDAALSEDDPIGIGFCVLDSHGHILVGSFRPPTHFDEIEGMSDEEIKTRIREGSAQDAPYMLPPNQLMEC